jgi:hypothetical protein
MSLSEYPAPLHSTSSIIKFTGFRSRLVAAALIIFLALTTAACVSRPAGEKESGTNPDNTDREITLPGSNPDNEPDPASGEYFFEYNGAAITMHAEADPLLAQLGKESAYFEAESCAFQGLDKTYSYPGFDLMTYPVDGKDFILSVILMDDSVTTNEGLYIGAPESEIIARLGDEYKSENGSYIYESGRSQLMIITENGAVTAIEYSAQAD